MPVLTKPTKWATKIEGKSITEPEHKDSCDINKMIRAASRGQNVRGGKTPQYGFDDMTMDGVKHRIQKAEVEKQLSELAQNTEFSEKQLAHIPESVQKKFKLKKKQKNDDQTTNQKTSSNTELQNSDSSNQPPPPKTP